MLSGVPAGLSPSLMNPMYCTNNPHARNVRGGINKQQRLHGRGRSTGGSSSNNSSFQQQQGRRNNHRGGVRKNEKETKGRGTTVQLNGATVLATDLVNGNCPGTTNKTEARSSSTMLEIGQFEDAPTGSSLASPAAAALAKAQ
ncbi:hypothetical protein B566_EDAN009707 [Ephemera danica]|nr:hypothetical protein B566_EDAN009707 [Ephemera danica]